MSDGSGVSALRRHLLAARPRMPRELRTALWIGMSLTLAYLSLMAAFWVLDRPTFDNLSTFLGLTLLAGREPAMLHILTAVDPPHTFWVGLTAVLGDVIALLVVLPLFWWGLERLRDAPVAGGVLLSVERTAYERRHWLDRWGMAGLALFVWIPALGTGPLVAGALGLVARIPIPRLLWWLSVSAVLVNVVWTLFLSTISRVLPSEGPLSYLPLAAVLVILGLSAGSSWRNRGKRRILAIEKAPGLDADHVAALRAHGITDTAGLLYVDCDILGDRIGVPGKRLGMCRAASGLMLLPTVGPYEAQSLAGLGVDSVRRLADVPLDILTEAIRETDPDLIPLVPVWKEDACRFLGQSA